MYRGYFWAVLIAFDQLGNALTGGHPDATVSARLGRALIRDEGWLMRLLAGLVDFAFSPAELAHCRRAYLAQISSGEGHKLTRGSDVGLALLAPIIVVLVPVLFLASAFWRLFKGEQ